MNVALFGLGPHAKRIYFPLLEKYQTKYSIKLSLLVDLEDQKDSIAKYLHDRSIKPQNLFLLNSADRNKQEIDKRLQQYLQCMIDIGEIDAVIISTEPKAHMKYSTWAIKNNINILIDKPLSSPENSISDDTAAQRLYQDFKTLKDLSSKSKSKCYVQCQRRYHNGYNFIWNYLKDFTAEYNVPITFMDIYHADGMWNMPNEFFSRENHPYKYGYGKLLHSGYHFLDLFSWFNEINQSLEKHKSDKLSVFAQSYRPYDFFHAVDQEFYQQRLPKKEINNAFLRSNELKRFGELDVNLLISSYRGDTKVTTCSCNLMQNSFSRRAWNELPEDTYKGNGRVRHERFTIQVSHLLSIQVHSYQAYEVKKKDLNVDGVGNEDHFDIYIFRNSQLVGGPALEKISMGERMKATNSTQKTYIGHNEEAREKCFLDFIEQKDSIAELYRHEFTNKLLATIYSCLVKESLGEVPYVEINI